MPRSMLIAACVLLSACATENQLLIGPRWNGEYTEIAAMLTISYSLNDRYVCNYTHLSELKNGPPFNRNPEQRADFLGCGVKWRYRPRN